MVPPLTRRSALVGAGVAVLGAVAGFAVARASDLDEPEEYGGGTGYGADERAVLTTLSALADGGVVTDGVAVSLGADGTVHAVSAVCTHQSCTVGRPSGGTVDCPCHGSRFDAVTGAVLRGPAARPLTVVPVRLEGDEVVRA